MTDIVIGLSAVIVAVREGEAVVLTVRPHDAVTGKPSALAGLPFGPFDPDGHRTFELAVRAFVSAQTRFELGFVEQLYTFGDKGRDAPLADVGAGGARVISVGYLALAPQAAPTQAPDTGWSSFSRFFPWEDWRRGRPALIDDVLSPAPAPLGPERGAPRCARLLFALDGAVAVERASGCWSATSCFTMPAWLPRPGATASGRAGAPLEEPAAISPRPSASPCCPTTAASWPCGPSAACAAKLKYRPRGVRADGRDEFTLSHSSSARWRRWPASPCTNRTSAARWSGRTWSRAWGGCTRRRGDGRRNCSGLGASWCGAGPRQPSWRCRGCGIEGKARLPQTKLQLHPHWTRDPGPRRRKHSLHSDDFISFLIETISIELTPSKFKL